MPNVTALPKSGSDGKIQREFYDVVGTTSTTYTYPSTQLGISVKNLGTANLTLTISGESKTIQPKKTESYSGSFTSFAIVAASGLVSFFADAYELDNDNPNVKLTSLTADVAQLKSGGGVDMTTINARFDAITSKPVSATLSITNPSGAIVECGTNLTDVTFAWSIANYTGVKTAQIKTGSTVLETLTAPSGNVTKAFANGGVKFDTVGQLDYSLQVMDVNDKPITVNASLYWRLAMYYGTSSNATLDEAGIKALTKELKPSMAGEYAFTGLADGQTNYKYFVIPATFATIALYNKSTGFGFPLIQVATVNVTNNGVVTSYKVLRSENAVGNATVRN